MNLLVSNSTGIYNWQWFATQYAKNYPNLKAEDIVALKAGPDHEWYHESVITVCDTARRMEGEVTHVLIESDGDIWDVTIDEYHGFPEC